MLKIMSRSPAQLITDFQSLPLIERAAFLRLLEESVASSDAEAAELSNAQQAEILRRHGQMKAPEHTFGMEEMKQHLNASLQRVMKDFKLLGWR